MEPVKPFALQASLLPDFGGEIVAGLVSLSGLESSATTSDDDADEFAVALRSLFQISALKCLDALLSAGAYRERMVVGGETTEKNRACDDALDRTFQLMVERFLEPSPIRRCVDATEMERAHGVLLWRALKGPQPENATTRSESKKTPATKSSSTEGDDATRNDESAPLSDRASLMERVVESTHIRLRRLALARDHLRTLRVRRGAGGGGDDAERNDGNPDDLPLAPPRYPPTLERSSIAASSLSPVQEQLLEMGFELPHVNRALESLGFRLYHRLDADPRFINRLISWMVDHPYEGNGGGGGGGGTFAAPLTEEEEGSMIPRRRRPGWHRICHVRRRRGSSAYDEENGGGGGGERRRADGNGNDAPLLERQSSTSTSDDKSSSKKPVLVDVDLTETIETLTKSDYLRRLEADSFPGRMSTVFDSTDGGGGGGNEFAVLECSARDPLGFRSEAEGVKTKASESSSSSKRRSLGQQANLLTSQSEREVAMKKLVKAFAVQTARHVVVSLLSLVGALKDDKLAAIVLRRFWLDDLKTIVLLARLVASGRVTTGTGSASLLLERLGHLLASACNFGGGSRSRLLVRDLCVGDLMSLVEKGKLVGDDNDSDHAVLLRPNIDVTKMLVAIVIERGGGDNFAPPTATQTTSVVVAESTNALTPAPSSNKGESVRTSIANALAACVLSPRLGEEKRQWAAVELSKMVLKKNATSGDIQAAIPTSQGKC